MNLSTEYSKKEFLLPPETDFTIPVDREVWNHLEENYLQVIKQRDNYRTTSNQRVKHGIKISEILLVIAEGSFNIYQTDNNSLFASYSATLLELRDLYLGTAKHKNFDMSLELLMAYSLFSIQSFFRGIGLEVDFEEPNSMQNLPVLTGVADGILMGQYTCYRAVFMATIDALFVADWDYEKVEQSWVSSLEIMLKTFKIPAKIQGSGLRA